MSAPRPILIHGSGGDHRVWALQSQRLAGAAVLDLPGHPRGEAATDLATLATVVAGALEPIAGPRVLVGHSLGGAAALEVARSWPDLVDGLVIVASGARIGVPESAIARARDDFGAERERLVAGLVVDPAGPMADTVRAALDACGPDNLVADYAACRSVDLRGRLGGVRVPTLVIAGADDPFTPPWLSEELARELPSARMVVIPGVRHLPMADAAITVTQLVAAYLARLEVTLMCA